MAYVQHNNPFTKTSCGRRRSFQTTDKPSPLYRCWDGYEPVPGKKAYEDGSCRKVPSGAKALLEEIGSPLERRKRKRKKKKEINKGEKQYKSKSVSQITNRDLRRCRKRNRRNKENNDSSALSKQ